MIPVVVPGRDSIEINQLVCDVNGTLTVDGILLPGVFEALGKLHALVEIHLVSADTLGKLKDLEISLAGIVDHFVRLEPGSEAEQKLEYIEKLDRSTVVAIGQGTNDRLMLKNAALGICVLSSEGSSLETLMSADVVVPGILEALELLIFPARLKATLRQ